MISIYLWIYVISYILGQILTSVPINSELYTK